MLKPLVWTFSGLLLVQIRTRVDSLIGDLVSQSVNPARVDIGSLRGYEVRTTKKMQFLNQYVT